MRQKILLFALVVFLLSISVVPYSAANAAPSNSHRTCFLGSSYGWENGHWHVKFNVGSHFNGWPNWTISTNSNYWMIVQIIRNKWAKPFAAPSNGVLKVGFPWWDSVSPWLVAAPWSWIACSWN